MPATRFLRFVRCVVVVLLLCVAAMPVLKWIQRYRELVLVPSEVVPLGTPPGSWAFLRQTFVEGFLRRLDDPSFWAVIAVTLAGALIVHAIAGLARFKARPTSMTVWGRWRFIVALLAVGINLGIYLVAVYHANGGEAFWYECGNSLSVLRNDVLVETLQDVEGWVNVVAIVCGGLLVVPFVSAVQVLRVLPATVPSRRSRSVASLVCSVGLVPVTVAFFAVFVYQVAEAVTQLSFAPLYFPMLKAAATAFLLCWPMFALSLWACRKLKRQHSLTVCTLKLIHLPIWVIMASLGWAGMSPPRALLDPSSIPSPGWRLAAQVVDGIGWLGVPIALWVSA